MKSNVTERHTYESDNNSYAAVFDRGVVELHIETGPARSNVTQVVFDEAGWARLKSLSEFLADVVSQHEKVQREAFKKRHRP